jgi:ribonuclease Z
MPDPLEVVFLGTGASWPSVERGAAATLVRAGDRALLVDAGEGTARQLARADVDPGALDAILLTHAHGDHVLGVPGLLWRLEHGPDPPDAVTVAGPGSALAVAARVLEASGIDPTFRVRAEALDGGPALRWAGHRVHARELDHSVPTLGYAFVPGEDPTARVAITGDTRPCPATVELASGADLLVHEATYADEHAAEARRRHHSTAREAGEVAREAGVDRLALTHVSPRYEDPAPLEAQARSVVDDAIVAEDLDRERLAGR